MFRLIAPCDVAIGDRLARLVPQQTTYPEVGALKTLSFPRGYCIDRNRILLGHGPACYERAKSALRDWEMFNVTWVKLFPRVPCIEPGTDIAISARYLGIWKVNVCRIVYTVRDEGDVCRFGVALGTLSEHLLTGEELFCVEWNRADDTVSYRVDSFSRSIGFWSRLLYPIVRRLQRRFARESRAAMVRACAGPAST